MAEHEYSGPEAAESKSRYFSELIERHDKLQRSLDELTNSLSKEIKENAGEVNAGRVTDILEEISRVVSQIGENEKAVFKLVQQ